MIYISPLWPVAHNWEHHLVTTRSLKSLGQQSVVLSTLSLDSDWAVYTFTSAPINSFVSLVNIPPCRVEWCVYEPQVEPPSPPTVSAYRESVYDWGVSEEGNLTKSNFSHYWRNCLSAAAVCDRDKNISLFQLSFFCMTFFFLVRSVRVTSLFLTQSVPSIVTVSFLQTSHLSFSYLPNCSFMGHAQLNSSLHFPQCISGKVPHKQQQQTTTYIWLNNVKNYCCEGDCVWIFFQVLTLIWSSTVDLIFFFF